MPISINVPQSSMDGTLSSWLYKINPKYAPLVACLQQLPTHDPVGAIWRRYVDRPRAWLYERDSGQGGFVGGISVMLVFPRISKVVGHWSEGHEKWPDYVSALGVPLLAEGVTSPTIHYLDFKKSPPNCSQDLDRPALLMSRPSWIPAWTIYPASGLSRGWHSIDLRPHNRTATLMNWMMQLAAPPRTQFIAEMVSLNSKLESLACTDWEDFSSWLGSLESDLAWSMIQGFIKHLNQYVLGACLVRRGNILPEEYNWVVSGRTAKMWEWRMDALRTFPAVSVTSVSPSFAVQVSPLLAKRSRALRELSKWSKTPPVEGTVAFSEVVDKGLPLIKALASSFGVRPVAIRSMHGVSSQTDQLFSMPPLGWGDLFLTLNAIAPERHPKSPDDWHSFAVLYQECVRLFFAIQSLHATVAQWFLVNVARPWMAVKAKSWSRSEEHWRDGLGSLADLHDAHVVAQEVRQIVVELGLSASERYESFRMIAALTPERWRSVIQKLSNLDESNTTPWHHVWHSGLIEGIPVRAINSCKLLFDEGKLMRHCIYTYRNRLQTERQLAFAIGSDGERDRSTLLVAYSPHEGAGWKVSVREHRAKFNYTPSMLCSTVAGILCSDLESPHLATDLSEANQARVRRCEERSRHPLSSTQRGANQLERPELANGFDLAETRKLLLDIITASSKSKS